MSSEVRKIIKREERKAAKEWAIRLFKKWKKEERQRYSIERKSLASKRTEDISWLEEASDYYIEAVRARSTFKDYLDLCPEVPPNRKAKWLRNAQLITRKIQMEASDLIKRKKLDVEEAIDIASGEFCDTLRSLKDSDLDVGEKRKAVAYCKDLLDLAGTIDSGPSTVTQQGQTPVSKVEPKRIVTFEGDEA